MDNQSNQKLTLYRNISIVLGLILLLVVFGMYSANEKVDEFKNLVKSLKEEVIRDGKTISQQHQNILKMKDAIELGLVEKEKYMKSIKSQQKFKTITKIDSIKIPYEVQKIVYVDSNTLDTSIYVKTPINVNYKDSWNFFGGRVLHDGFALDSMGSINKYRVTIGKKKQGFLKKAKPIVEVKNENPNTKINEISNVQIEDKKPFYQRWWFAFGLGGLFVFLL